MIRARHLKGSLVLATAAAAALAACGRGGESIGDGDGDTGDGDIGDGDGDIGDGDGDSGGSTASGGGSGTGGDGNMGGLGGMGTGGIGTGGMGTGASGPTREELVDEFCPDPADEYFIFEGTEGDDAFPDVLGEKKVALVAADGNDSLGYVKYGTETACFVAGAGDDSITITGLGTGTAGESSSDLGFGYIVLGDGADVVNYAVDSMAVYAYRTPAVIADFESGTDKLRFELEGNRLPSTTVETSVVITSEFTSDTASTHNSCQTAKIYIDSDDGEVWLSRNCEGSRNDLLMTIEGDVPEMDDIEIYYREVANTPELAADQVCMNSTGYFETIVEGTEGADNFGSYSGLVRTLTLGYEEDDVFSSPSTESGGPGTLGCMVGGHENDTFNVTTNLSSLGQTEFFGGPGADVLDYASSNDGSHVDGPGTRATIYLRDFKSGVDKLRFSQTTVNLSSTNIAESVVFSATDFNSGSVQTYESCSDYKLVVDQTDGEVWLSHNYCETADDHNMLLLKSLGDVPTADDIVIY